MASYDNLPLPRPRGDFDPLLQGPNVLNLDEQRLYQVSSDIREQGITRDQLRSITNRRFTEGNPLLSHVVGYTSDGIQRNGGDVRSFNRGAILGLYLIGEASEDGVAPVMGIGSAQLAAQYRNWPPTLEDLKIGSRRVACRSGGAKRSI